MTANVALFETTELPAISRLTPPTHAAGSTAEPEQLPRGAAGWLAGAPTTPVERADPLGWYQHALTADAGAPDIPVLELPVRRLSSSERAQAQALSRHPLAGTDSWAGPTWSTLVKADRQVVTHVGTLSRVIQIGDLRVPVGGLTGVMTLEAWRGHGYAHAAVAKATAFAGLWLWAPFVVTICPRGDTAFYESSGWHIAETRLWCTQPAGRATLADHVVVFLPSQGEAAWPSGPIDLCGLPW